MIDDPADPTAPEHDIADLRARVGGHDRSIERLEAAIGKLNGAVSQGFERLADKLTFVNEETRDRLNKATRPDFKTIWSATSVVLAIIVAFGGMVSGFAVLGYRNLQDQDVQMKAQQEGLDVKLQREFDLALSKTETSVTAAERRFDEGRENLKQRVTVLERFVDSQVQAELNELRERRRDTSHP